MTLKILLTAAAALLPAAAAQCDHPYFPAYPNTKWTYSSSTQSAGFTQRVVSNAGNAIVLENAFAGGTKATVRLTCADNGSLVQPQYAAVSGTGLGARVETLSFSGAAFPPPDRWSVGTKWSYSYRVRITVRAGGQNTVQTGSVKIDSTISAQEDVKVPAGTFSALKVDQVITSNLSVNVGGRSTPINTTLRGSSWYANGVGMVRNVTNNVTQQLVSFVKV